MGECFEKECPVDCKWDKWKSVGKCSKECGTGVQKMVRKKKVKEAHGGKCSGPSKKEVACNTQKCPVDCEWSEWTHGECSVSCGGGHRKSFRTRKQDAKHGGQECNGTISVRQTCNENECKPIKVKGPKTVSEYCDDEKVLTFQKVTRRSELVNNLGGVFRERRGKTIKIACIMKQSDGRCINLEIFDHDGSYARAHRRLWSSQQKNMRTYNGIADLGALYVWFEVRGSYSLRFAFTFQDTGKPAKLKNLPLAFYDLDSGKGRWTRRPAYHVDLRR